ncbi:MAG: hypothetical protein D6731_03085 [Planctomycetota bacterium]|nr:MAG: hypothetical protein D6731_03085 [Planctomycetota bacterium]
MLRQRTVPTLGLVALAGCVSTVRPLDPEPVASAAPWLGRWDQAQERLDATGERAVELSFFEGMHMQIGALRASGRLPPPAEAAAEVLVVTEGQGILEAGGQRVPLDPGCLVFLPKGARGALLGDARAPVYALVARRPRAPVGGAVRVLRSEEAFPRDVVAAPGGNAARVLAELPGAFTARLLGVSGVVDRHLHRRHDELWFVISGWGTLGVGNEGTARNFISQPLRERSLVYLPPLHPHSFADEGGRTILLALDAPPLPRLEEDTVAVPTREKANNGRPAFPEQVAPRPPR